VSEGTAGRLAVETLAVEALVFIQQAQPLQLIEMATMAMQLLISLGENDSVTVTDYLGEMAAMIESG